MAPFDLTGRERSRLRELIATTTEAPVLRRAQALLGLAQGDSPYEVAEGLRVSRQTLYNWAHRFRDRRGSAPRDRLADAPRSGRPCTARGVIDPLLDRVIDDDPRDWGYQATVWTAPLLQRYLWDRHRITVSRQSVSAAIDRLGIRWKRPRHRLALRPETWRQAKGA
jgi:transposase